jgi:hypothetical protein
MSSPIVTKAYIDAVHAERLREAQNHNIARSARRASASARVQQVDWITPRLGWFLTLKDGLARVIVGEPCPGSRSRGEWAPAEVVGAEVWVGRPRTMSRREARIRPARRRQRTRRRRAQAGAKHKESSWTSAGRC